MQTQQIDVAAAVQRQRQKFLGLDHVAELRRFRLHLHRVRFHADRLLDGSDFQHNIDFQAIVHLHINAGRLKVLETGRGPRYGVCPGRQRQ